MMEQHGGDEMETGVDFMDGAIIDDLAEAAKVMAEQAAVTRTMADRRKAKLLGLADAAAADADIVAAVNLLAKAETMAMSAAVAADMATRLFDRLDVVDLAGTIKAYGCFGRAYQRFRRHEDAYLIAVKAANDELAAAA
jgi:hypothetical protein